MDPLPDRIDATPVSDKRQPFGNAAAAGCARMAPFRINRRLRRRDGSETRREHLRSVLLLAAFLLVGVPPLARMLGGPQALGAIFADHGAMLAGVGVLLILLVLGEHLLVEFSRLARLSETISAVRPDGGFLGSQQLSAVHHDGLAGDP